MTTISARPVLNMGCLSLSAGDPAPGAHQCSSESEDRVQRADLWSTWEWGGREMVDARYLRESLLDSAPGRRLASSEVTLSGRCSRSPTSQTVSRGARSQPAPLPGAHTQRPN